MATVKYNGGSSCAVDTCPNYSSKAKNEGRIVSFHRFPKDPSLRDEWVKKCNRNDKLNPSTSAVCSDHFKENDFVRDLKTELLGYTPKAKKLKPDVITSLNLPADKFLSQLSLSAINHNEKMKKKLDKQTHDQIIESLLSASCAIPTNEGSIRHQETAYIHESLNYVDLYNKLLEEHRRLSSIQRWTRMKKYPNKNIHDVPGTITLNNHGSKSSKNVSKIFTYKVTNTNEMTKDAIEYLAGWVAKKYRTKYPELDSNNTQQNSSMLSDHIYVLPFWINHLAYDGLSVPSSNLKKIISRCEWLFKKLIKHSVLKGPNFDQQLSSKMFKRMMIDTRYKPVIQIYVRQRMIIHTNYMISLNKNKLRKSRLRLRRLMNKFKKIIT